MIPRYIRARHYTLGRSRRLRLIVWHTMEARESVNTAERVAFWFAGLSAPRASPHICADQNSVVECVKPWNTAWHAPGANADGYGIELAGYARQTRAQWADPASVGAILNAARFVAPLMRRQRIPARWLTDRQLARGRARGMVTHSQVSRVFRLGDHTDPGPNFPKRWVAEIMRQHIKGKAPVPPVPKPPPLPPDLEPLPTGHDLPTLERGDMGENVRNLQVLLNGRGAYTPANGVYDAATEGAVRAFRRSHGLPMSGKVDAEFWGILR